MIKSLASFVVESILDNDDALTGKKLFDPKIEMHSTTKFNFEQYGIFEEDIKYLIETIISIDTDIDADYINAYWYAFCFNRKWEKRNNAETRAWTISIYENEEAHKNDTAVGYLYCVLNTHKFKYDYYSDTTFSHPLSKWMLSKIDKLNELSKTDKIIKKFV